MTTINTYAIEITEENLNSTTAAKIGLELFDLEHAARWLLSENKGAFATFEFYQNQPISTGVVSKSLFESRYHMPVGTTTEAFLARSK